MNHKMKEDHPSYCFPRDFNATPSDAGVSTSTTGSRNSSRSSSPKFDPLCYRLETITSPASRETLAASPTPSGSASSVSSSTSGSPHHRHQKQRRPQPGSGGRQSPREHHHPRRRYKPPLGSNHRHSRSVLSDNASETYVSSDSEGGSEEDEHDEQDNYYYNYEEEGSQHAKDDQSTVSGRSCHSGKSSIGISIAKQQQPLLSTAYISTHEKSVVLKHQPPSPRNQYQNVKETFEINNNDVYQNQEIIQQLALSGNKNCSRTRPFETNDDLADLYQYSDEEDSLADLNELIAESSARWKNDVELVVHKTVTSQTIQQKQQQQLLLGTTPFAAAEAPLKMTAPLSISLPNRNKTKESSIQPIPASQHKQKQQQKPQTSEIEALRIALEKTNVGQKPASVVPVLEVVANHPTSSITNDITDTAHLDAVLTDEVDSKK